MLTITITGTSIQDIVNQANALTQGTVTTLGEITGQAPATPAAPAPKAPAAPAPKAPAAPAPKAPAAPAPKAPAAPAPKAPAAPAPKAPAAPAPKAPAPKEEASEGETTVTLEQLRGVGKQIIAAGKQAAMKEYLQSIGTDSLTNAEPSAYADILAGLNSILNGTSESDGL